MRENRLKTIWQRDGTVVNGWLQVPSPFSAEVMAHAGYDSLTIDMQHGRVPWHDPGLIMRVLDAGCYAVICPMINTREEAESFVGACRYPPAGYRSFGPYRATLYGGRDYPDYADEIVVTMAMIETKEALENLEEILDVDGLDAIFIGPSDLGQSLGYGPGMDREEPEVVEAIDNVLAAAHERGLAAGIFAGTPVYASRMVEKGFQFVNVSSDARLMASAATETVSALKGEQGYH